MGSIAFTAGVTVPVEAYATRDQVKLSEQSNFVCPVG